MLKYATFLLAITLLFFSGIADAQNAYETTRIEPDENSVITVSSYPVKKGGFVCDYEHYSSTVPITVTRETYHLLTIGWNEVMLTVSSEVTDMKTNRVLNEGVNEVAVPISGFFKKTGILELHGTPVIITKNSEYDVLAAVKGKK